MLTQCLKTYTFSRNLPVIQGNVKKLIEEHSLKVEIAYSAMQVSSMAEALRLVFVKAEFCSRCLLSNILLKSLRT